MPGGTRFSCFIHTFVLLIHYRPCVSKRLHYISFSDGDMFATCPFLMVSY